MLANACQKKLSQKYKDVASFEDQNKNDSYGDGKACTAEGFTSHHPTAPPLWAVHSLPQQQQWCSMNTIYSSPQSQLFTVFLFKSVNGNLSCLWPHQWSSNLNSCVVLNTDMSILLSWLTCLIFFHNHAFVHHEVDLIQWQIKHFFW